jgi:hypothetical protein
MVNRAKWSESLLLFQQIIIVAWSPDSARAGSATVDQTVHSWQVLL